MRGRRERRLALATAVILVLGPSIGLSATPRERAAKLRAQQTLLTAKGRSALLSLYALDSRLARARTDLVRAQARARELLDRQREVDHEVTVAELALLRSQRLLGAHLRAIYEQGDPDVIGVILGATSVEDALARVDDLQRIADQGERAVETTRAARARLKVLARRLAQRVREARAAEAQAAAQADALAAARSERVAYIGSLARQRRLNAREIASLDTAAQKVVAKAQTIEAATAPAAASTPAPAAGPGTTLTVTATGYSLTGQTATGIPVAYGVVAVDPSVIPLGTRMTIPGYGEGVAADTGSAVQGYTIDLWFPTQAQALAWGRRTVTITLH